MNSFFKDEKIELFNADCTQKSNFDTEFFDLGITSPPYNVGIEYGLHDDNKEYKKYLEFSKLWLENCYFWAKDGARFCLNIPLDKNKGGQKKRGC